MRALAIIAVLAGCADESPAVPVAKPKPRPPEVVDEVVTAHRLYPVVGAVVASDIEDRGPPVPKSFWLPPRPLRWTTHANCELDANLPSCGPDDPEATTRYRVGRGSGVIVVEGLRRSRIHSKWVYLTTESAAARRVTLDDRARPVNMVALGADRYTSRDRSGANALAGCSALEFKRDAAGRIAEERCVRRDGSPMRDGDGVAIRRFVRDERGFAVEERRFDSDGKPVTASDFGHRVIRELDAFGRIAHERYRGVGDTPVESADGCFGWRYEREHGEVTRATCLDADDKPIASASGVTHTVSTFDRNGCTASTRYLGPDGKPVLDDDGVHGIDHVRDASCRDRQRTCVGASGTPVRCGLREPARFVDRRDGQGRIVSTKHYDADGKPAADASYGAFEVRQQWDDADRMIAMACHDATGAAIECAGTGFHRVRSLFDAGGREVERRFFDEDGAPVDNRGSIGRRFRYDEYDHVIEATNLETDGTTVDFTGAKTRRNVFDAYHRLAAVLMFDRDGRPARYRSCFAGVTCPEQPWHAVRIERRTDGHVERNLFFDHAAQLIKTVHCTGAPCFE